MFTIRELAELAGVSVQAMYRQIKRRGVALCGRRGHYQITEADAKIVLLGGGRRGKSTMSPNQSVPLESQAAGIAELNARIAELERLLGRAEKRIKSLEEAAAEHFYLLDKLNAVKEPTAVDSPDSDCINSFNVVSFPSRSEPYKNLEGSDKREIPINKQEISKKEQPLDTNPVEYKYKSGKGSAEISECQGEISAFSFPLKNGQKWELSAAQVNRIRAAHPAADLEAELNKALGWLEANPTRRKTERGMMRFLSGWFGRVDMSPKPKPAPRMPVQKAAGWEMAATTEELAAYLGDLESRIPKWFQDLSQRPVHYPVLQEYRRRFYENSQLNAPATPPDTHPGITRANRNINLPVGSYSGQSGDVCPGQEPLEAPVAAKPVPKYGRLAVVKPGG